MPGKNRLVSYRRDIWTLPAEHVTNVTMSQALCAAGFCCHGSLLISSPASRLVPAGLRSTSRVVATSLGPTGMFVHDTIDASSDRVVQSVSLHQAV